jgi:chorismate dehydratase
MAPVPKPQLRFPPLPLAASSSFPRPLGGEGGAQAPGEGVSTVRASAFRNRLGRSRVAQTAALRSLRFPEGKWPPPVLQPAGKARKKRKGNYHAAAHTLGGAECYDKLRRPICSMAKVKVSVVQYLNTVPLIWGMLREPGPRDFEMTYTTPARCADEVRSGAASVGIIPSIELQRINNLEIISGVSISSLRKVRSVALFSKKSIERIGSVAMDTSSRTSVALLTILLNKFYGISPRMTLAEPNGRAMLQMADAALLIGDPALACNSQDVAVYDMAEEWRKFTGLPFVFAVWAGAADSGLAGLAGVFRDSRDYGLAHVDEIAAEYAPRQRLSPAEVKIYLTENIDYNLAEKHLEGLNLFHKLAYEAGLVPGIQDVRFVK